MDPRLAELYHTNEDTSDVEKTAAAELAEKLASADDVNIDGMSNEDIEALAKDVLSTEEQTEEPAAEETEETEEGSEDKTAEAKFQEADYLGRVMAHAYVNELKDIDKDATEKTAGKMSGVMSKIKGMAGKAKGKGKEMAGKAGKMLKKHKKKAIGAAAAGGAAAAFGAGRMSKQSSAVDALALERAKEILAENGYEVPAQTEEAPAEGEKQASKYDVLAEAVEARAMELLKAEGFKFEGDEATEE